LKKISLIAILTIAPTFAFAADTTIPAGSDWILDIRRIGLDVSKTNVTNGDRYYDSPIQALKASDQDYIKSVNDINLDYTVGRFNWDTRLFTEYGRTKISPDNAPSTTSENADKILLSSDASYHLWDAYGMKFGPTAGLAYETEFTANGGVPRQQVARANAGFKIFDHPIIKDLHLVGIYEYDFTFSNDVVSKTAAEFGWRLEYQIRDGVKVSTDGYYREYLSYSAFVGTDLERDLSAVARLDTNVWGNLTVGPYVQYRLAKSREASVYASNLIIGLSFNYITKFEL
jgi:hypothetical protein